MQIKIRYDNHFQTVEVTEQECANMIRADYEERLAAAADPSTVQPRTMQEIMDERFNKPEYNCYHAYSRRTSGLEACDFEGESFIDFSANQVDALEKEEMLRILNDAMKVLQPQQKELVYRVFYRGECPKDIAIELGITKQAMNNRLNKIYAVLRKFF